MGNTSYVSNTYTLKHLGDGREFTFKSGKMAIIGGEVTSLGYGDDIVSRLYNAYPTLGVLNTFSFNGLDGCEFDIQFAKNDDGGGYGGIYCTWRIYIHGLKTSSDYNISDSSMLIGYKVRGAYPYNHDLGLYFAFMPNNPLYEGQSIYPFHFMTREEDDTWKVAPFHEYTMYYDNRSDTYSQGDYIPHMNVTAPKRYLLKDYHLLSFSDASEIEKQGGEEKQGFPYGDGESEEKGGSQGTMEDTSEPIELDISPSAFIGGLYNIYELNGLQMSQLSNWLTSPDIVDSLVKLWVNPMDYFIKLSAMPISFTGQTSAIVVGGKTVPMESNPKIIRDYIQEVDCGSVEIPKYFDSFLDWSPFTKLKIYIPYSGIHEMSIDPFVGGHINLQYRVDCVTGDFVCVISNDESIVDYVSGNMAYGLPLRANDSQQLVSGLFSAIGTITAPLVGGVVGASASSMSNATADPFALEDKGEASAPHMGGMLGAVESASFKPSFITGGTVSGNSGALLNRKPYVIIERPTISLPEHYGEMKGFLSRFSARLGDMSGFTVVEDTKLEFVATADEKREIESLLKSGVIL